MPPMFWTLGCVYGASSVMLGAFGAHGLKKRIADPQRLQNWGTAAHYQVCTDPFAKARPDLPCLQAPAGPFRCASLRELRGTEEQTRNDSPFCWHARFQRLNISSHPRSCTLQGSWSCHSTRRSLLDRELGRFSFHKAPARWSSVSLVPSIRT